MTDSSKWNDSMREDLRETLRTLVIGEVRLSNSDHEEILETCREVYIEDECP